MDTTGTTLEREMVDEVRVTEDLAATPDRRVRTDLVAGAAVVAAVIVGNLLWHASDTGILAALSAR